MEIEVETGGSLGNCARSLDSDLDSRRIYLKQDSSLGNDDVRGLEIVTHPHSPAELRAYLPKIMEAVRKVNMTGYEGGRCGIHIHISRQALTNLQLAKMIVFLSAQNSDFLTHIAQRSSNQFAEIKRKRLQDPTRSYYADDSRYQALNLNNSATVEIRIFRSTSRTDRAMKCLEFTLSLIEYCRDAPISKLDHLSYLKWLSSLPGLRKDYPNLLAFLQAGKYANHLPKPTKGTTSPKCVSS